MTIPETPIEGERYIKQDVYGDWEVWWYPKQILNLFIPHCLVYEDLPEEDARLLAFGEKSLSAVILALKEFMTLIRETPQINEINKNECEKIYKSLMGT